MDKCFVYKPTVGMLLYHQGQIILSQRAGDVTISKNTVHERGKKMRVLFCEYDGGNELMEVERNDISDLLAILNSKRGKAVIQHDEDEYFYGSLQESCLEMLIDEATGEHVEVLKLFFAKELRNVTIRGNALPFRALQKTNQ